jgi:small subunit ribosomal protein S4e
LEETDHGEEKLQHRGGVDLGNKGPVKHMKRHKSPSFWPIDRKTNNWAVKTSAGPHSTNTSIPSNVLLRNELKVSKTARESKYIIKRGKILIDGKPRLDTKFPIGLMDTVSLPDKGENYRVLPGHNGKFKLVPISEEETKFKLYKIIGKQTLPNGLTQLNLHDGQNQIIPSDADNYNVNDVLKLRIPEKEIMDHIEFKEMQQSIITGGRSQGAQGMIVGFSHEPGWKRTATIRTEDGEDIRTLAKYVFVVGAKEPVIKLNEDDK